MMRKALILTAILAIVAIPMAVGNIGFCRAMPCCPPHLGTQITDAHHPDCCNTSNCAQAPAAGREYTSAKQFDHHASALVAVAVLPTVQAFTAEPASTPNAFASVEPRSVQQRIALLSVLLV